MGLGELPKNVVTVEVALRPDVVPIELIELLGRGIAWLEDLG